jgi:beta-galactosidase
VHELDFFSAFQVDDTVYVHVEKSAFASNYSTGYKVRYKYRISAGGVIRLETQVSPRGNQPRWLPKIGLQMALQEEFRHLEWFGRGPFETYPDRKTGAKIGLYRTTAEADYVPYIIPQDYGNKTDVRWLRITDEAGLGLYIHGEEVFQTSLQVSPTGHLDRAHYPFQLQREGPWILNLDHRVSGVGCTAMSVLNPYRVLPADTRFVFYLKPDGPILRSTEGSSE